MLIYPFEIITFYYYTAAFFFFFKKEEEEFLIGPRSKRPKFLAVNTNSTISLLFVSAVFGNVRMNLIIRLNFKSKPEFL